MTMIRTCAAIAAIVCVASVFVPGDAGTPPKKGGPFPVRETIRTFPSRGPMRTAWKVRWTVEKGPGLVIHGAWLKKGPDEPWTQVLADSHLAEMFVPYDSGTPRFWDLAYNYDMLPLAPRDVGPGGRLHGDPPIVAEELRDRGIHYMDPETGARRGETLVLWAALDATNYRYITEYGFQDDGVVTFRAGSTGRNYESKEYEGHMHHALWRVDVDLDGPDRQGVYMMERHDPDGDDPAKARTVFRAFNGGKEGAEDWDPRKFACLHVVRNDRKNARGKPIGYEVMLHRTGTARHFGPEDEDSTLHDFWVTRHRPGEMLYQKVPHYVRRGEPILDANVVLWISTPHHHEPRTEDGAFEGKKFSGATAIAWAGFDLRPRNFFDRSPHFPPEK